MTAKIGGNKTSFNRFDPPTRVEPDEQATQKRGQQVWVVRGGLSFYSGPRQHEYWIQIPAGFRTVGADVPSFAKSMISPDGPAGQAAIIHNYLCEVGRVKSAGVKGPLKNRKHADRLFLEAMKVAKVGFFKRWFLYLCARCTRNQVLRPESQTAED